MSLMLLLQRLTRSLSFAALALFVSSASVCSGSGFVNAKIIYPYSDAFFEDSSACSRLPTNLTTVRASAADAPHV